MTQPTICCAVKNVCQTIHYAIDIAYFLQDSAKPLNKPLESLKLGTQQYYSYERMLNQVLVIVESVERICEMGTNYYADVESPCPECGRGGEALHIGKSSAGWRFLFASYEDKMITSWSDWKRVLSASDATIRDEYGREHTLEELSGLVERKQSEPYPNRGCSQHEYIDADGYRISRGWDFF